MPFTKPFTSKDYQLFHKQKVSGNGHFLFDSGQYSAIPYGVILQDLQKQL